MPGMYRRMRDPEDGNTACIFVHAGAGYHSKHNEPHYLAACNDAAKTAMCILKLGGSAVDAVEMAVRILEDREITNAGYGSNLTIDGTVECDAVVVDHCGRSGAAGAVAQVKNPISLARVLLDRTSQTLSLDRIPPNLLVGQGAIDFAYEHRMEVVPFECLTSPSARGRWETWTRDLARAEAKNGQKRKAEWHDISSPTDFGLSHLLQHGADRENVTMATAKAMKVGVWNEAQIISAPPFDDRPQQGTFGSSPLNITPSLSMADPDQDASSTWLGRRGEPSNPYSLPEISNNMSGNPFANSTDSIAGTDPRNFPLHAGTDRGSLIQQEYAGMDIDGSGAGPFTEQSSGHMQRNLYDVSSFKSKATRVENGLRDSERVYQPVKGFKGARLSPTSFDKQRPVSRNLTPVHDSSEADDDDDDKITDTVGAIAIDLYGNIACGSSSGGTGMKHRGRVGPAALVGIGAAVIPVDTDDPERCCIATVTSGTGEHMSTTHAASLCSERVYQNRRKLSGATYAEVDDDGAVRGFIEKDFMGHPSVKNSHPSSAIGVLSVKKTKDGAYLYFGHNTSSFALASMHSGEANPVCAMSRSKAKGVISQGGRAIRYKRRRNV